MNGCVVCTIRSVGDPDGWVDVELSAPLTMRTGFTDHLAMPTMEPGLYQLCPACAAWRPDARTAPLPLTAGVAVARVTAEVANSTVRRRAHAETLGWLRHLAQQLQPTAQENQP